ncbi:hypothetical protein MMC07_002036 [Pseudocyphellaria aurata]|nr:hypothetical protein [Pseudocyphellaria aurata]
MASAPKQPGEQFRADTATFEGIPKIRQIAPDSSGRRVEGKVVVITGGVFSHVLPTPHRADTDLIIADVQEPIRSLELDVPARINSPIMALKPFICVITATTILQLTGENCNHSTLASMFTADNSTPPTKPPSRPLWMRPLRNTGG